MTSLYDCLIAMQDGLTDDSILDKYSEVRRKKWQDLIDPISRANFRRIWDKDVSVQLRVKNLLNENDPYVLRAVDDGKGNAASTTILVPTFRELSISVVLNF